MVASEAHVQTTPSLRARSSKSAHPKTTSTNRVSDAGGIDVSRLSKGSYSHNRCRKGKVGQRIPPTLCAMKVQKVKVGILLPGLRSNLDTVNFVQCRGSIPCFLQAYPELDSSPFGSQ
jgi:hypothetical protein